MSKKMLIEGLFEIHNVEIDLDNRLSIMIGENGIGKTTILNIIYYLSTNDLPKLTKYTFKRINLITDQGKSVIDYCILFPDDKFIISNLNVDKEITSDEQHNENVRYFKNELRSLYKKNKYLYSQFLGSCFHNDSIERMKSRVSSALYEEYFSFCPVDEIKRILNEKWFNNKSRYLDYIDYIDSKYFFVNEVINLNMVIDYKYRDFSMDSPPVFCEMLSWLDSFKKFKKNYYNPKSHLNYYISTIFGLSNHRIIGLNDVPNHFQDEYLNLVRSVYKNIELKTKCFEKDIEVLVDSILVNEEIDINRIINKYYYDVSFIERINRKAIDYYIDLIGENDKYAYVLDFFSDKTLTSEILQDIINYIEPLIIENSEFAKMIDSLKAELYQQPGVHFNLFQQFLRFYKENIDEIKNSKSEQMKVFEDLLNEFIINKSISVLPSGIKFFPKVHVKNKRNNFKLIINDKVNIPISALSSGERKILTILIIAIFYQDKILLIDEPELSLSLVWQEKLLPLLMEKTNINKIIVATHSPYLVSNGFIADSIVPLPLED